ncbi:MAG: hypothetical protein D3904_12115 [Candidatus Electrothrix sp. EH2]|nr:hypothetical protein [Candidatus Electrothrix sp. EH2]
MSDMDNCCQSSVTEKYRFALMNVHKVPFCVSVSPVQPNEQQARNFVLQSVVLWVRSVAQSFELSVYKNFGLPVYTFA